MAMTKKQKREAAIEAARILRDEYGVKKGDTLYTSLLHASASGMLRVIRIIKIKDSKPFDVSYRAAQALEWPYDEKRGGVRVSGCGMDMGFHTIYELSGTLFKDGYALNQNWL